MESRNAAWVVIGLLVVLVVIVGAWMWDSERDHEACVASNTNGLLYADPEDPPAAQRDCN